MMMHTISGLPTISTLIDQRGHFLSFVRRRIADPAVAEDILQAAYLRAVERSADLRQNDSAKAWFYRILRNAIIDHYRRRASEISGVDQWLATLSTLPGSMNAGFITVEDGKPALATNPDIECKEICPCIETVLDALSPSYAGLLREVELEEASLADFARRHSITASNAAVRAHRARAAFKRALERICGSCALKACADCTCAH